MLRWFRLIYSLVIVQRQPRESLLRLKLRTFLHWIHDVETGSVVAVPAGEDRGVKATNGRLEAVLVTASPPTNAEHEPVRRGLKQGEFEPNKR